MATEVYTTEEIRLQDETEVILRPLAIAKLRKFTRLWTEHLTALTAKFTEAEGNPDMLNDADITDTQFDVFIKLCALCLDAQLKGEKTDKQFASYLEDVLDEKTIYKILDVCGGLKLGEQKDPNLPAANLAAVAGTV